MKRKTVALKDLIDKIDWLMIEPGRGSLRLGDNEVSVSFSKSTRTQSELVDRVKIRFGREVIKKLKWNPGDKLCIYNDPDSLLTFMIAKSDSGRGYTIVQETNSPATHVVFKWKDSFRLSLMNKTVPFEIHKGYLLFKATESADDFDE